MMYEVTIEETLSRCICVKADSAEEAESIVRNRYDDGEIVLGADDFEEVEFFTIASEEYDNREDQEVSMRYNGIDFKAVKNFCEVCEYSSLYSGQMEFHGLTQEKDDGTYFLTDGKRVVRFFYDIPELPHAPKRSELGILEHLDRAKRIAETADVQDMFKLPSIEDVERAKKTGKSCFLLADGKVCVNVRYLLDMMRIFPDCKTAIFTGENEPLYFDGTDVDGLLLPMKKVTQS